MIDRWGNSTTINSGVGTAMADRIGRMLSRAAFGGGIATAGNLATLETIRPALVRASLTKAIEVGAALRRRLGDENPLKRLLQISGGKVLGAGTVRDCKWRDTEPYTFRELTYRIEDVQGATIDIWIKNEHHIVRRNEQVIATSPDVIAVLDANNNRPLTSLGDVYPGLGVVVIGVRAIDPIWDSPKGQDLLGPRHFGFDFDPVKAAD
jgi:DUF917 family protein